MSQVYFLCIATTEIPNRSLEPSSKDDGEVRSVKAAGERCERVHTAAHAGWCLGGAGPTRRRLVHSMAAPQQQPTCSGSGLNYR